MGLGSMDREIRMGNLLRDDIDYRRPQGGGARIFDLVGELRGKRVLDLGCGLAPYRKVLEERGARWVGVDLRGKRCSALADGFKLPFRDGSFDLVLSAAVLEHLPEPGESLREVHRILADEGTFFGYVAFLEPLHGLSYFHMSHLGLEYLLYKHGFQPLRIFPSHASPPYLLESILFPKPVPVLQTAVRHVGRASVHLLLAGNRAARGILCLLRGLSAQERRREREQYRLLLALRYAVGVNFIARRRAGGSERLDGYLSLIKEG